MKFRMIVLETDNVAAACDVLAASVTAPFDLHVLPEILPAKPERILDLPELRIPKERPRRDWEQRSKKRGKP